MLQTNPKCVLKAIYKVQFFILQPGFEQWVMEDAAD